MNTKKLVLTGLAALAIATINANAQAIPVLVEIDAAGTNSALQQGANPVVEGDLILAARQAGKANDLVIDLGNASNFTSLAAGSTHALGAVNGADFTAAFGSTAFTSATTWSVFAGNGGADAGASASTPNNTLWATTPWASNNTYNVLTRSNNQGGTSSALDTFTNSLTGGTSASNLASQLVPSATGYTQLIGTASPFSYFSVQVEGNLGSPTSKVELWKLTPGTGAGTDLGYFTLSTDGTSLTGASFTAFSAIPEPSTYAAILGLVTLGVAAIRRRKQAQVAV